jgi:hypothetical protein
MLGEAKPYDPTGNQIGTAMKYIPDPNVQKSTQRWGILPIFPGERLHLSDFSLT